MSKYKDFVEEYNLSYKFSHNKKYFSYPNLNSIYNLKKNVYYTAEPTEQLSDSPTTLTPSTLTNSPTTLLPYTTKCPSITNFTSFMPTLKIVNNNINNINNNNDLIIALTIPFSAIFLALILFTLYYYKFYLKYTIQQQREREKEFDLDFGLSYVDDF
jgi:hypothetical protein